MTITINGNGTVTGVSVGGLPDGIVDTDMIAANAVTVAKASGSVKGITIKDQWRVTSNFTGDAQPISSNWERIDSNSHGVIGSAMTESSGVFTFPETGIWEIEFNTSHRHVGEVNRWIDQSIYITENNSSYTEAVRSVASILDHASGAYGLGDGKVLFDVTNVSTHKVRFHVTSADSDLITQGHSTINFTYATFTRVGDT